MLLAADFRQRAREALRGNWLLAVLTGLVASLLGASIHGGSSGGGGRNNNNSNSGYTGNIQDGMNYIRSFFSTGVGRIVLLGVMGLTIVVVIWVIVMIVIGGAVTLGYAQFNLNLVDYNNPQFSDLFVHFNRFGTAFVMQLLRAVYIFLWTLLFIIPGIIASYKYAMAPYILAENPGMDAAESITVSKEMMDGNKWRLFCLEISFIGWAILCLFTLGIGYLWLIPYQEAARAAFYRELTVEQQSAFQQNTGYESQM